VQDLEHQLYEAKLTQYESAKATSDAGTEDGSDGEEEEAPNTSVMQEMTAEEKAKFEDLKSANAMIDELEAEVSHPLFTLLHNLHVMFYCHPVEGTSNSSLCYAAQLLVVITCSFVFNGVTITIHLSTDYCQVLPHQRARGSA
jgi:hypothetical protein